MQTEMRLSIHAPYVAVSLLANVSLFVVLMLVMPLVVQIHINYAQQLSGLAQLFFNYKEILGLLIVLAFFVQLVAIIRRVPSLYHFSMASSILTVLFLVLTILSATLFPVLRLINVVDG